jgi:hypothetical protein
MTIPTDESIIHFLEEVGEDPDEHSVWIDSYRIDEPDGDASFEEYYELCLDQKRMFNRVDWDGSDSDISFSLSQAYAETHVF